jgi:ABC-2 type transport system permease protein
MSFWRDTWIIFRRQMRMALRNPAWVIIGLLQPILYLVLFGPLLEPLAGAIGTENAYTFFVPGLLVQLGIFGAFFAGFSLISEWRAGVVEAERVTPASRVALLVGRVLRDVVQLFVQGVVLIALAFAFGLRASIGGMLLGLAIVVFLGIACASASNALALTTKSEDVMAPLINSIALPVLLLSGILLPISAQSGAPDWLVVLSDFMPTKYIVHATRDAFASDFATANVLWGIIWTIALTALAVWAGTRTFRRENA